MLTKMQSGEDFAIQTKGGGRIIVPNVVAEPQFNPTSAYAVDAKVWYGSVQYVCTTATTEPAEGHSNPTPEEDTAHWAALPVEEMAKKPATFTAGNLAKFDSNGNPMDSEIPAANVAQKSNIPYDRITITTGQLQDHAEQKVTLNAATTTLTLPALTTGKVSDFGIDVVNGYEVSGTPTAASFSLDGTLGTDYNLIVPDGENWSEMSALAAGEMAVYYFTLSAFQINDKPTWEVMKKVVELVPVPSAP